MPKLNDEKPQAVVSWCAIDIQEKRPDWSVKRCQDFLDDNEDHIQLAMIEAGGDAIDECLWEED
jgi:hypothetical protein